MAVETLLSVEEYLALPHDGIDREYDEGRVIEMSFVSASHAALQGKLCHAVHGYIERTGTPLTVMTPTGYWVAENTERGPDVPVVRTAMLAAMPVYRGSKRGAPDLAIEIVSPGDTATEIERKTRQYIEGGAMAVWVLYEESRSVVVERKGGMARFGAGEFLEEPELMPGLRISIDWLFAS